MTVRSVPLYGSFVMNGVMVFYTFECAAANLSLHFYEDEMIPKNNAFERSHTLVTKFFS